MIYHRVLKLIIQIYFSMFNFFSHFRERFYLFRTSSSSTCLASCFLSWFIVDSQLLVDLSNLPIINKYKPTIKLYGNVTSQLVTYCFVRLMFKEFYENVDSTITSVCYLIRITYIIIMYVTCLGQCPFRQLLRLVVSSSVLWSLHICQLISLTFEREVKIRTNQLTIRLRNVNVSC